MGRNTSRNTTEQSLSKRLLVLYHLLPTHHRRSIWLMLTLQIGAAISEIISLGAVIPFLGALSNAPKLLQQAVLQPWLAVAGINTGAQLIYWMAGLFVGAFVLSNVFRLLTIRMQYRFSAQIGSYIASEVFRYTLYQPYSYHVRHSSGEVLALCTHDSNIVSNQVLPALFYLVTNALVVVAISASLLYLNPLVALGSASIVGGAYALINHLTKARLVENGSKISTLNFQVIAAVQEGVGGIRDVLIDSSQPGFVNIHKQASQTLLTKIGNNNFISMSPRFLVEPIAMAAIAGFATFMVFSQGEIVQVLPLLGALALGANRLLPALQQSFSSLSGLRSGQASLAKVLVALKEVQHVRPRAGPVQALRMHTALELENIGFSYRDDGQQAVLHDLNLRIPVNATVAFVGTTGSGKSTTADLILGLLKPQHGLIKVDGVPLAEHNIRAWQASIAHVPQQCYLSDASIAENIAFGVPLDEIDMTQVKVAARTAHIEEFIESRPSGYHELVGERGIRLSGGQRQRICIARALYKKAALIVFDEATSALDNTTEREVMKAILELNHQVTIVLIAHRISTVKSADLIVEFDKGHIKAQGTYESLIEKSSTFKELALR